MAKRRYDQRLRAEAAEETRLRILDAVGDRLREAPAEPVSVDRIARMAGVARSTVYLIFGSRAGLFEAFADHLFERTGYERLLRAVSAEDAREHMAGGITTGAEMFGHDRDVWRALISMSHLDPEAVGNVVRRHETERAGGMKRVARRLAEQGYLRDDATEEQAADMLWLFTGFDAFDVLYTGRGMSVEETGATLVAMAERAVLRPT
jgi:AcrR family transcriptional regulator